MGDKQGSRSATNVNPSGAPGAGNFVANGVDLNGLKPNDVVRAIAGEDVGTVIVKEAQ